MVSTNKNAICKTCLVKILEATSKNENARTMAERGRLRMGMSAGVRVLIKPESAGVAAVMAGVGKSRV